MSKLITELKRIKSRRKALKRLMKRKRIVKTIERSLAKRHRAEKRFRAYGVASITIAITFLFLLLFNIIAGGYSAFIRTNVNMKVTLDTNLITNKSYATIGRNAFESLFDETQFSSVSDKRKLFKLLSKGASYKIADYIAKHPEDAGKTVELELPLSSAVDMYAKGNKEKYLAIDENLRELDNQQVNWVEYLHKQNRIKKSFNSDFFNSGDSREPELAGVLGGLLGSFFIIVISLIVAFPIGVATAIYLEEFAPKNKISSIIEVNINNLAAVPSIVYGLLGLTIYLQFFGMPRSSSLVGGLTLSLMALPIIVIASRTSIRAIPQSIRDGAIALGASKLQTTIHHVLPLAMPGIMTGTILSVARVLGETAPLLMIGMVAFIVDVPKWITEAATALPVQIFLWADSPEQGFLEKTSAAIIVLLLFLVVANALAVFLRKKFEIRW